MSAYPTLRVLGMMSGTSVDSIDSALCSISCGDDGRLRSELIAFSEHPMSDRLRRRIFRLFQNGPESLSLACSLNFEIAEAFAEAASACFAEHGIDPASVDAIASHGQTAYHIAPHMVQPATSDSEDGAGDVASTLQIGDASVLAMRTGVRVVADFRTADMAAGGNGAPLVPFADWHLFSRPGTAIVVHNLGGIANLTLLPASGKMSDVLAFDTGPANMIMDALVARFYPGESCDREGNHARAGTVMPGLLEKWMAIPYISAAPPKSTGRELFGVQFAQQAADANVSATPDDLIATATEFTARSFAQNVGDHVLPRGPLSEILLAGGGAHNPFLRERIAAAVHGLPGGAGIQVKLLDEAGFPSKARECIAFALLGYARLNGIPGNVPSATGAKSPALLGKVAEVYQRP